MHLSRSFFFTSRDFYQNQYVWKPSLTDKHVYFLFTVFSYWSVRTNGVFLKQKSGMQTKRQSVKRRMVIPIQDLMLYVWIESQINIMRFMRIIQTSCLTVYSRILWDASKAPKHAAGHLWTSLYSVHILSKCFSTCLSSWIIKKKKEDIYDSNRQAAKARTLIHPCRHFFEGIFNMTALVAFLVCVDVVFLHGFKKNKK